MKGNVILIQALYVDTILCGCIGSYVLKGILGYWASCGDVIPAVDNSNAFNIPLFDKLLELSKLFRLGSLNPGSRVIKADNNVQEFEPILHPHAHHQTFHFHVLNQNFHSDQ